MAKKSTGRRLLALTIAAALCTSMVRLSSSALDAGQTTGSGTQDDPYITVTITENPQQGQTSTETKTEYIHENKEYVNIDIQSQWNTTDTTGAGTDQEVTTTVTGEETEIVSTVAGGNQVVETGEKWGQETTDITDITTQKETTYDQQIGNDRVEDIPDPNTDTSEFDTPTTLDSTDNDWVIGTPTGELTPQAPAETNSGTLESGIAAPGTAELNMTPGGTDTETYTIKAADILSGAITLPAADENTTIEPIYEDNDPTKPITGYKVTKVTTTRSLTGSSTGNTQSTKDDSSVVTTYYTPSGYTPGITTRDATNAAGQKIGTITEEIKPIYEDDDPTKQIIGYEIITTTETEEDSASTASDIVTPLSSDTVVSLPIRPAESETGNVYGGKTTVAVEDILDKGVVVGYKTTVTVTDKDGKVLSASSLTEYGTTTVDVTRTEDPNTEKTTIRKTETTKVYGVTETYDVTDKTERTNTYDVTEVTETDIYQLVETADGLFFIYNGEMYAVKAVGTHGDTTLASVDIDEDLIVNNSSKDLRNKNGTANGLFSGTTVDSANANGYPFEYVGNGLASTLRVSRYIDNSLGHITNHQFALRDADGNIHYVYCADIATDAVSGFHYDMQNLSDQDYYQGDNAVAHIRAIVLNGFWGTEVPAGQQAKNVAGTLDAVKELLKSDSGKAILKGLKNADGSRKFSDTQIENAAKYLTEGQALTATQAAIWNFGNNDSHRHLADQIVQKNYNNGSIGTSDADSLYTQILYELLIRMEDNNPDETDIIDAADIAAGQITLKGKATDAAGAVKTDAGGNELYNTDVSFTMSVAKTSVKGDLVVHVYSGQTLVGTYRLTDDNTTTAYSSVDGNVTYTEGKNGSGTYTISNIELAEGVKITLNLEGTQNLKQGVYLYSSETLKVDLTDDGKNNPTNTVSQAFVGMGNGSRKVDLEIGMIFTASEADTRVSHSHSTVTKTGTQTSVDTKTDTRKETRSGLRTLNNATGTILTQLFGDVTTTTVTTLETETIRKWQENWTNHYTLEPYDDEFFFDDEEEFIEDEDVALANVPTTGDTTILFAATSMLSALGILLLGSKRKED